MSIDIKVSVSWAETTSWGQIHVHDPKSVIFIHPQMYQNLFWMEVFSGYGRFIETFWR